MEKLFTIDKKDYIENEQYVLRNAVRGIILKNNKIMLVQSNKFHEYKFPGGGQENSETHLDTLIREVREEAGLDVIASSVIPFAYVTEIRNSKNEGKIFKMNSYYYYCNVKDEINLPNLIDYEKEYGYILKEVSIEEAYMNNLNLQDLKFPLWIERETKVLERLMNIIKLKQEILNRLINLSNNKENVTSYDLSKSKYESLCLKLPVIKEIAKELVKTNQYKDYLLINAKYYEELQIQFYILGFLKDFDYIIEYINNNWFKVENWAICDSSVSGLRKIVSKNKEKYFTFLKQFYLNNKNKTFSVRLVVVSLLNFYINQDISDNDLQKIFDFFEEIDKRDDYDFGTYYVKMAVSWALQVAFAKKHDYTLKYLINNKNLCNFTYNKALQKIIESFQTNLEEKDLIRSLRRK